MSKRLVIIDGKSVFYRGYYAMPNLSKSDGTPTGGVYGFSVLALELLRKLQPDYVCVAWDKPKTNIRKRKALYSEYKAGRKPPPDDFYDQVPLLHELLRAFNWPLYELDDYEADDIMATLAQKAEAEGLETILISSDLDLLQALDNNTKLYALKKGLSNIQEFDLQGFTKKYGIRLDQFIDLKSLKGDSSDNIPGVAGVGEKTAVSLLQEYDNLDNIYDNLALIKPAWSKKLEANKDMAYLSKQLVTLETDAPVDLDLDGMRVENVNVDEVRKCLLDFEFSSLLRQLPESMQVKASEVEVSDRLVVPELEVVEISKTNLAELKAEQVIVCSITNNDSGEKRLWVLADDSNLFVINLSKQDTVTWLKSAQIFRSNLELFAYDAKYVLKTLLSLGIEPDFAIKSSNIVDVRVAAFVKNSILRDYSIASVLKEASGLDMDEATSDEAESVLQGLAATKRAATDLKSFFGAKANQTLGKVYYEIDAPSIPVLAKLENAGMYLDQKVLKDMSHDLEGKISDIEQTIYGMADKEFNISSPSQLAEVLFADLKLSTVGIKKGKTGYSTAASELAKLQKTHPIIDMISSYRELTKLMNTYVEPLPDYVGEDGRVHSTLHLTGAATGRLSSSEPNLQNIPVRREEGRRVRQAFVAEKGNLLISADYSQFELRLAAVLSGDEDMVEAFNSDIDIHALTASQVFGVALEDVSKEQRYQAKAVNFGILYGQGVHGLSQQTGMSYAEAKDFIDRYFSKRPKLKDYLNQLRTKAKEDGYVETLLGRRRPTPDVKSRNFVVRESAYRQAVNMPIQGTEADLMKLAMIKLDKQLDDSARQIMQVHDSIIVECPESDAEKVATIMKDVMENIYPNLGIHLKVDVQTGRNWGEI